MRIFKHLMIGFLALALNGCDLVKSCDETGSYFPSFLNDINGQKVYGDNGSYFLLTLKKDTLVLEMRVSDGTNSLTYQLSPSKLKADYDDDWQSTHNGQKINEKVTYFFYSTPVHITEATGKYQYMLTDATMSELKYTGAFILFDPKDFNSRFRTLFLIHPENKSVYSQPDKSFGLPFVLNDFDEKLGETLVFYPFKASSGQYGFGFNIKKY